MVSIASIATTAALVGDPARAAMLQALMDGRALTAGELAGVAGISAQTASGHLAQLAAGGLIRVAKQGRRRYHRLARPEVARLLEDLMLLADDAAPARPRVGPSDARLRFARTCYDHIAGRLGVAIADGMSAAGWIEITDEAGFVTEAGVRRLVELGVDVPGAPKPHSALCRPCLDWSERRLHVGGRLGAALCAHGLARGWIRKRPGSRALDLTPEGRRGYREAFQTVGLDGP